MRAIFSILVLVCLGGCAAPRVAVELTQTRVVLSDEAAFAYLWDASQDVLRAHLFQIDRKDLRAGVITTFPETSQSVLEFWRHDVATPYDLLESTLHTIRRQVKIQIVPVIPPPVDGPDGMLSGDFRLVVEVSKQRFHLAERQISNAAAALRLFGESTPMTQGSLSARASDRYWTPAGRDPAMEQYLLDKILEHLQTQNNDSIVPSVDSEPASAPA